MSVVVFSEKDDTAFELLAKARELFPDAQIGAALLAPEPSDRANDYISRGADVVHFAYNAAFRQPTPEVFAHTLKGIVEANNIETIFLGSSRRGKQTASLLAQMLECGCVTDAIEIRLEGNAIQADRYSLAGNTIATETIQSKRRVIAVMPHSFKQASPSERNGMVKEAAVPTFPAHLKVIDKREKKGEHVNLEDAKVIIGAGKGFAKQEDLKLVQDLAATLNAEIGCTRPLAVDFKWLAEDRSIGLSSKKVSPELYIAIGISGQIQHTVGVMRSGTIVAINKTEDAPIFSVADYGIVGDLYKVVPKFTQELKKVMKK